MHNSIRSGASPSTSSRFTRLEDDALACAWCGSPLPEGADASEAVTLLPESRRPGLATWAEPLGVCDQCAPWAAYSMALAKHPQLSRLGPARAESLAITIAAACCVLDTNPPHVDLPSSEMSAWTTAFSEITSPRWAAFIVAHSARSTAVSPSWSFVSDEQRASMRAALAAVMAEKVARTAPDQRLAPPPVVTLAGETALPGGCLICGRDRVLAPAVNVLHSGGPERAARAVWTRHAITTGRGGERLAGYVCPDCEKAVDQNNHATGPTAYDIAVTRHLGLDASPVQSDMLRVNVEPWWASPDPTPSRRPWSHLGDDADLEELRAALIRHGLAEIPTRTTTATTVTPSIRWVVATESWV